MTVTRWYCRACGNGGRARSRSFGPQVRAAVAALSAQLSDAARTATRYVESSGGQLRAVAAAAAWRVRRGSAARPRSFAPCGLVHCTQAFGAPAQLCGAPRHGQRASPVYNARFEALQRRGEHTPAAVVRARQRAAWQRPERGLSKRASSRLRQRRCNRPACAQQTLQGRRRARSGRRAPLRRRLPWAPPPGAAPRPARPRLASRRVKTVPLRRPRAASAAQRRGSGDGGGGARRSPEPRSSTASRQPRAWRAGCGARRRAVEGGAKKGLRRSAASLRLR